MAWMNATLLDSFWIPYNSGHGYLFHVNFSSQAGQNTKSNGSSPSSISKKLHTLNWKQVTKSLLRQPMTSVLDYAESLRPDWPGVAEIEKIVKQAAGLFIYATTAVKYIRNSEQDNEVVFVRG